ncbi:MAG: tRNA (guanosine(37)-N1)-methyltransferase TrmD [Treponema sp.]|nr:tRNA (guanosine(37)-N1)-methyltransferase TrmD [Treponema sp.]
MRFTVVTLFPDIVRAYFESSIMAKAVANGLISYTLVNIRDFAVDRHKTCDDAPYGGGAGQLMCAEPIGRALAAVQAHEKRVIYVSPGGKPFSQQLAALLSQERELVIVCGRYEGIDQRIIDAYVDDEISIGDYVLSSGEVAAEVLIDAVYRLIDGVITLESLAEESFCGGLLEYPQYTRPAVYGGRAVPDVLLSGNHEEIRRWRLRKRIEKTLRNRPELIARARAEGLLTSEAENVIADITAAAVRPDVPYTRHTDGVY